MHITIHDASLSDCEAVYPLICALASGGRVGGGSEYKPDFAAYVKTYKLFLTDTNKKYFIAKDGAHVVGVAGLTINQSLVEAGNFAYIEELVVSELHRRGGVGQKLLETCIAFAKEQACQSIGLTTGNERYAAHALYEKKGFQRVGVKYVIDFE